MVYHILTIILQYLMFKLNRKGGILYVTSNGLLDIKSLAKECSHNNINWLVAFMVATKSRLAAGVGTDGGAEQVGPSPLKCDLRPDCECIYITCICADM